MILQSATLELGKSEFLLVLGAMLVLSGVNWWFPQSAPPRIGATPAAGNPPPGAPSVAQRILVWFAQGLGLGRIPGAPGTFGSLLGLAWTVVLLGTRSLWTYAFGAVAGLGLSVWVCGKAETLLGRRDPPSVVLDEIAAMPVCFLSWVFWHLAHTTQMLAPSDLIRMPAGWMTVATFAAFRVFDILKPWPVRQSQSLPGGWGVTVDDLLAAVYVNLVMLVPLAAGEALGRR